MNHGYLFRDSWSCSLGTNQFKNGLATFSSPAGELKELRVTLTEEESVKILEVLEAAKIRTLLKVMENGKPT